MGTRIAGTFLAPYTIGLDRRRVLLVRTLAVPSSRMVRCDLRLRLLHASVQQKEPAAHATKCVRHAGMQDAPNAERAHTTSVPPHF